MGRQKKEGNRIFLKPLGFAQTTREKEERGGRATTLRGKRRVYYNIRRVVGGGRAGKEGYAEDKGGD